MAAATNGMDATLSAAIISMVTQASGTYTFPTVTGPIHVRLMTTNATGDNANGTELASGGSYIAGTGITTAGSWGTATTSNAGSAITNSGAAISQTNMPAATIQGVELWDSTGTPKRCFWGPLTANKTTNLGDTLTFAASSLSINLA